MPSKLDRSILRWFSRCFTGVGLALWAVAIYELVRAAILTGLLLTLFGAGVLAYARFLLGSKNVAGALKEYDATARLDPKSAEAHAYGGWIVYLAGLPDEAMKRFDAAVAADPNYPDAHLFRGIVLFQGKNDACHAKPELQRYLAVANQTSMAPAVQQTLEAALKACPDK